jgi:hypothetical protein
MAVEFGAQANHPFPFIAKHQGEPAENFTHAYSLLNSLSVLAERALFCIELEQALMSENQRNSDLSLDKKYAQWKDQENTQNAIDVLNDGLDEECIERRIDAWIYLHLCQRQLEFQLKRQEREDSTGGQFQSKEENKTQSEFHENGLSPENSIDDSYVKTGEILLGGVNAILQDLQTMRRNLYPWHKSHCSSQFQSYRELVCRYYDLLSSPSFSDSASDVAQIQGILDQAVEDEDLSLLLNEVDAMLLKSNPINPIENGKVRSLNLLPYRPTEVESLFEPVLHEFNHSLNWQEKLMVYQDQVISYYHLLTKADLANSDAEVEMLQSLLDAAAEDETLGFLLNEVDYLISQDLTSMLEESDEQEQCQKFADSFRTHIDTCQPFDDDAARLITKISSLIKNLQHFRSSDRFDPNQVDNIPKIDEKVKSLKILKREVKVQKKRKKLEGFVRLDDIVSGEDSENPFNQNSSPNCCCQTAK